MPNILTTTGSFEQDNSASLEAAGRRVVRWVKRGVEQPLFPSGTLVAHRPDRHGLPILVEQTTETGMFPLQVTVGYGDTIELA